MSDVLIYRLRTAPHDDHMNDVKCREAADELDRLRTENARLISKYEDLEETFKVWFDTKAIARDEIGPKMLDAARGYLRTSRVGGMPTKESDLIEGVIADMIHLGALTEPVTQYLMTRGDSALKGDGHE